MYYHQAKKRDKYLKTIDKKQYVKCIVCNTKDREVFPCYVYKCNSCGYYYTLVFKDQKLDGVSFGNDDEFTVDFTNLMVEIANFRPPTHHRSNLLTNNLSIGDNFLVPENGIIFANNFNIMKDISKQTREYLKLVKFRQEKPKLNLVNL
jgi:hypothetical protein